MNTLSTIDQQSSRNATTTVRLTAAQALIAYLGAQSTERDGVQRAAVPSIFGIYGHGNAAGIGQALTSPESRIRYLQGKNEQAMVHAAIGFAKEHQRLSVMGVTTSIGPGATNLVTGAATATINRIPVLLLPGDTFAAGRQRPVLQQLEHTSSFDWTVNECLRPVSRFFARIQRPEQLIEVLPHAVAALFDPVDTGAVTIAISQDVQGEAFDCPAEFFQPRVHLIPRQPAAAELIHAAVERICVSEKPVLIAGGGVRYSEAAAAVARLSNQTGIPIAETFAASGCASDAELAAGGLGFIGSPAANELARQADLVIAVGTRLADTVTGSHSLFANPDVQFISINLNQSDAIKLGALPVVADARAALETLCATLTDTGWHASSEWQQAARSVIDSNRELFLTALQQPAGLVAATVVEELARHADRSDVAVLSASTMVGHAHSFWHMVGSARIDFEYGFSCMGHELPAALGVRLAGHKGNVYAVIGDGTYLMGNTSELVTAIQEGVAITVIVVVNNGFRCIGRFQENAVGHEFGTQFRQRTSLTEYDGEIVTIDYAANAAAFGCATARCHTREELREALKTADASTRPFLIEAHVGDDDVAIPAGAWWDHASPEVSADPATAERHGQYVNERDSLRWYV